MDRRIQNDASFRAPQLLLLLLSGLYLICELIFNYALVTTAGKAGFSSDDLRALEYFGRAVSGIGASLLVAGLFIRGANFLHSIGRLAVVFVAVWPLVFFGQKWLIDTYIVEPSSPQQRSDAYGAQLARSAIESGALQISGFDYRPRDTIEQRTFMTLFGGLLFWDSDLMAVMRGQQDRIVDAHLRRVSRDQAASAYQHYAMIRDAVVEDFREYRGNPVLGANPHYPAKQGLSWEQFQRSPEIQARFRLALADYYVDPTLAAWNDVLFERYVVTPTLDREKQLLLDRLTASVAIFADGEDLAESGREAVRAVVVPPIAMALSLFLAGITAIKLLGQVAARFIGPLARGMVFGASLATLLAAPVAVHALAPPDKRTIEQYFVRNLAENQSIAVSKVLIWTLTAQPVIAPLGEYLENRLGLYREISAHL